MAVVCLSVQELPLLLEALIARDHPTVETIRNAIGLYEQQADKVEVELCGRLPESLVIPLSRMDILHILQLQDSIVDTAEEIASLLVVREMVVLDEMRDPLLTLTRRCVEACDQAAKVISELDELLEVGFRGREAKRVVNMIALLSETQTETAALATTLAEILFHHEQNFDPVSVLLWFRVIGQLSDIADYAEGVGDRVRLLIAL